ncbi:MAG: hypothetical protein ACTSP4_08950 [Candidatus Hodarchaeales archaeon]
MKSSKRKTGDFSDFIPAKVKRTRFTDERYSESAEWPSHQRTFDNLDLHDPDFMEDFTNRFNHAKDFLSGEDIDELEKRTQVPIHLIERFARDLM